MAPAPSPRRPPDDGRSMPAGHAVLVVVVALLLGAVLNASSLAETASRRPFGWQRTVAVVAVAPVQLLSSALKLDRPHELLAAAASDALAPGDAASIPVAAEPAEPTTPDAPAGATAGNADARSRGSRQTASRRAGTRRDPLETWVGGDSLASEFGPALADQLARTGRARATVDFRYSSGLARPDFFDWPGQLRRVVRRDDPDVVVVVFGANDGQNIEVDGTVLAFGSPQWRREYARRVDAVIDRVTRRGRSLYWVGQPIMRSPDFDARMSLLNDIYRERARGHRRVTFIDSRKLFTAPGGGYAPVLPDRSGGSTLMRQQDGVHLTRAGGERLAAAVLDVIADRWPVRGD